MRLSSRLRPITEDILIVIAVSEFVTTFLFNQREFSRKKGNVQVREIDS